MLKFWLVNGCRELPLIVAVWGALASLFSCFLFFFSVEVKWKGIISLSGELPLILSISVKFRLDALPYASLA